MFFYPPVLCCKLHATTNQGQRAVGSAVGILWVGTIGVLLQLNYFPGVISATSTFTVGSMSTSINVVAFCNRQIVELILFSAKNAFAALMHPDCYVLIKADMAIEELTVKDVSARKARHKRMSRVGSFVGTDKSVKRVMGKSFKRRVQRVVGDRISSGKSESLGRRAVGTVAVVAAGAASAAAATVVAVAS